MTSIRAARFAATYALLRSAADVSDHWVQSDHQATTKGKSGAAGRRACAAHVASYTAVQAGALLGGARLLGLRLRGRRVPLVAGRGLLRDAVTGLRRGVAAALGVTGRVRRQVLGGRRRVGLRRGLGVQRR